MILRSRPQAVKNAVIDVSKLETSTITADKITSGSIVIDTAQFSINETYIAFLKHHGIIK